MEKNTLFATEADSEEAREKVLELTGMDIGLAKTSYGSRNVTFVFSESIKPSVIRISPAFIKPLKTVFSELMFVDYLREHIHTVCNPVPFANRLVNVINVGGEDYYVVVSRKANGISPAGDVFNDEKLFESYGKKLGQLHAASKTSAAEGFKYMRPRWTDAPGFNFDMSSASERIPDDIIQKMIRIRDRVSELPETADTFGMVHGDMSPINSFLDWEDVWLFDFDDCCYHYFMYDICCFLMQASRSAAEAGAKFDPTAVFRGAYEHYNILPDECWTKDYMGRFYTLRIASGLWLLGQSRTEKGRADYDIYYPRLCDVIRGMEI